MSTQVRLAASPMAGSDRSRRIDEDVVASERLDLAPTPAQRELRVTGHVVPLVARHPQAADGEMPVATLVRGRPASDRAPCLDQAQDWAELRCPDSQSAEAAISGWLRELHAPTLAGKQFCDGLLELARSDTVHQFRAGRELADELVSPIDEL
jgi:hypothetical protein